MARKHRLYVVGFDQDKQVIYGGDNPDGCGAKYIEPMTLKQARKQLSTLMGGPIRAIYKLVPVVEEHPNG